MKTLLTALLISLGAAHSHAQIVPGKLTFALPEHPGKLSLDQGGFEVKELSAKANGNEWGVRAESPEFHLLAFLFAWPEQPQLNAETCRDEMLKSEGASSLASVKERISTKSSSGVDIALALLIPENGSSSAVRAFVASGDLCGDVLLTYPQSIDKQLIPMAKAKTILDTITFDPKAKPTFRDAFAYATVVWEHHAYAGAASAYQAALALVDTSDDPLKWRRVTTDQLSMSYGIAGNLKQSRSVNQAAISRDPSYPLYYYNLACADAEEGNAAAARTHLQQAFERKGNTLPGEQMPDPATDDSILKLKRDKSFWAFVMTLSQSGKQ